MRGKRILLVEDSPDIQVFVTTIARMEGADLVAAGSGEEGLARYQSDSPFDVVLLDVNLPGISGWEVLDAIKRMEEARPPPVVIFTAIADEQTLDKAERLAATDVIIKPIGARELVARLNDVLRGPHAARNL